MRRCCFPDCPADERETATELAAAASVMREHMVRWDPAGRGARHVREPAAMGPAPSTSAGGAALVIARAGVRCQARQSLVSTVAERRRSDRPGSGCRRRSRTGPALPGSRGLAFCFARSFIPPWPMWAALRRRLRVLRLFNLLGPAGEPGGANAPAAGSPDAPSC